MSRLVWKSKTWVRRQREDWQAYLDEEMNKRRWRRSLRKRRFRRQLGGIFFQGLMKMRKEPTIGDEHDHCDFIHALVQNIRAASNYTKIFVVFLAN